MSGRDLLTEAIRCYGFLILESPGIDKEQVLVWLAGQEVDVGDAPGVLACPFWSLYYSEGMILLGRGGG